MPISMSFLLNDGVIHIPNWVIDHASYMKWITSANSPSIGRFAFYDDSVHWECIPETSSHEKLVAAFRQGLRPWTKRLGQGEYITGHAIHHSQLAFTVHPDGMFVEHGTFEDNVVQVKKGAKEVYFSGTPDMVLEVVSKASALQDNKTKKKLYHQAGVKEYWMVDSRLAVPPLLIYRNTARGFAAIKPQDGWLRSSVFGASFRLAVTGNEGERRKVQLQRR